MRMKNKVLKVNVVNQLHFKFFLREKEMQDPYLHKAQSMQEACPLTSNYKTAQVVP